MKQSVLFFSLFLAAVIQGCGQASQPAIEKETKVGGACEGCEAIHESPVPFEKLSSSLTLPDFEEAGERIEISGIVYRRDGKTPAGNVVIYVYHTDQKGEYSRGDKAEGWGRRHGYIRGWLKTDDKGYYSISTLRPASYPDSKAPQHIHITVKEQGMTAYWIDDFFFSDDPNVAAEIREGHRPRGGSGIITLSVAEDGIRRASRNITLGLNIPDYPEEPSSRLSADFRMIPMKFSATSVYH